jgi:hypothetical protein
MRSRQIQDPRFPCWRVVFVCVFLVMVVFIAFEVLDLDGSNLRHLPASTSIAAAEPALADVEQLLPERHSVPGAQSRVPPCVDSRPSLEAVKLLSPSGGKSLIARLDHPRPRSFLRHETPPPTPLSDDPA